jgi:hypothetical protein
MKIAPASLPAAALRSFLPTVPVGTRADLTIGRRTASIVKLDEAAVHNPARLQALVGGATKYGPGLELLKGAGGIAQDASVFYTAINPGQGFGAAVEYFAILGATAEFAEAIMKKKGFLRITLAGAEVGSTSLVVAHRTPLTVAAAAIVRILNRFFKAIEKPEPPSPPSVAAQAQVTAAGPTGHPGVSPGLHPPFLNLGLGKANAPPLGLGLGTNIDGLALHPLLIGTRGAAALRPRGLALGLLPSGPRAQDPVEWQFRSAMLPGLAAMGSATNGELSLPNGVIPASLPDAAASAPPAVGTQGQPPPPQ